MTFDLGIDDDGASAGDWCPRHVTKGELLAKLDAIGCTFNWRLQDALESCDALASVRACVGDIQTGCRVAEFKAGVLIGLLPDALRDWPTWYIRLPESWSADVQRLVAQARFVNHVMRDEWNPWYVAQWLAIISAYSDSGWPADARRLDIDDREIEWMLDTARHTEAVLVIFECSGILTLTAYPVDEELACDLQAGGGCSSRHALFDLDLAEVQAMTRALEDGTLPKRIDGSLRLTVVPVDPLLARDRLIDESATGVRTALGGAHVSGSYHDNGLIGIESDVLDWQPPTWTVSPGLVLRLSVPWRFHELVLEQGVIAKVARVGPRGEAPALVALTLTSGSSLYVAEMRLDDSRMVSALQRVSAQGCCRVILVNELNGRPHVLTVHWPSYSYMDVICGNGAPVIDIIVAGDSGYGRDTAKQLVIERGSPVSLHTCLVEVATRR